MSQATGRHFNSRGHSLSDMRVCIVEKMYNVDRLLREELESDIIRKFNSKFKGLNTDTWIALQYVLKYSYNFKLVLWSHKLPFTHDNPDPSDDEILKDFEINNDYV